MKNTSTHNEAAADELVDCPECGYGCEVKSPWVSGKDASIDCENCGTVTDLDDETGEPIDHSEDGPMDDDWIAGAYERQTRPVSKNDLIMMAVRD